MPQRGNTVIYFAESHKAIALGRFGHKIPGFYIQQIREKNTNPSQKLKKSLAKSHTSQKSLLLLFGGGCVRTGTERERKRIRVCEREMNTMSASSPVTDEDFAMKSVDAAPPTASPGHDVEPASHSTSSSLKLTIDDLRLTTTITTTATDNVCSGAEKALLLAEAPSKSNTMHGTSEESLRESDLTGPDGAETSSREVVPAEMAPPEAFETVASGSKTIPDPVSSCQEEGNSLGGDVKTDKALIVDGEKARTEPTDISPGGSGSLGARDERETVGNVARESPPDQSSTVRRPNDDANLDGGPGDVSGLGEFGSPGISALNGEDLVPTENDFPAEPIEDDGPDTLEVINDRVFAEENGATGFKTEATEGPGSMVENELLGRSAVESSGIDEDLSPPENISSAVLNHFDRAS
jgi:hypothetical protein